MIWNYGNDLVTNIEYFNTDVIGFVYKITNLKTNEYYIGKKNLYSTRKRKFGKKEIQLITDKRLKKYEMVTKESDWLTYKSSNTIVQKWEYTDTIREILHICNSSKKLTYYELKEQILHDVLRDDKCLNENLMGSFFRKDLIA